MINTGTLKKLTGVVALFACMMGTSSQAEPLNYSSDRWPARWSSVVQQQEPLYRRSGSSYGYGQDRQQTRRQQDNPWAHNGSGLFDIPSAQRPWGEPPRKSQRRRERAAYYREPAVRGVVDNYYPAYGYGAGSLASAYTQPIYSHTYPLGGLTTGWPYGVSPLLASPLVTSPLLTSPLLTSPLVGYPYGAYPTGLSRMNWPFGAW